MIVSWNVSTVFFLDLIATETDATHSVFAYVNIISNNLNDYPSITRRMLVKKIQINVSILQISDASFSQWDFKSSSIQFISLCKATHLEIMHVYVDLFILLLENAVFQPKHLFCLTIS